MGRRKRGEGISVLLVTPKYPPYMGGAATDYYHLVETLRGAIDFTILTCAHRDRPLVERLPGARILRILPPFFDSKAPVRFLLVPLTFLGAMVASFPRRSRVVHAHSTTSVGLGALLFGGMTNQPLIKEFTDQGVRDILVKLRRDAVYLARGQTIRDLLVARGISEDRIHTVHSLNVPAGEAVALVPSEAANGGSQEKVEALFAGSLNCRIKGLDVLVEAFRRVAATSPQLHLTLVGEGPDEEWLRRWVERSGLQDRVTFRGNLAYSEVLQEIARCDFMVLPSRAGEAYPRVIVEAFLFRKPVVSTRVGDIPLILGDGKGGLLTEPGDVEDLALAMERLGTDPDLRQRLGESGHDYLKGLPSWDSFSSGVRNLYVMAAGEGPQPIPPPAPHSTPGEGLTMAYSPTVSVVVTVLNSRSTLADCVQSLLGQTYPRDRYEVILVDGGSRDGSPEIMGGFPIRVISAPGTTIGAGRNRGIQASTGEIVAITDGDIVADRRWLEELVAPFEDPAVGAVGGPNLTNPRAPRFSRLVGLLPEESPHFDRLQEVGHMLVYTRNAAYRREAMVRARQFNEGARAGEDPELNWRISQLGYKLIFNPGASVWHYHRTTLRAFIRQHWRNGHGVGQLSRVNPRAFNTRKHIAASVALLLGLGSLPVPLIMGEFYWAIIPGTIFAAFVGACLINGFRAFRRSVRPWHILPVALLTMAWVPAWLVGYLRGRLKPSQPRKPLPTLLAEGARGNGKA